MPVSLFEIHELHTYGLLSSVYSRNPGLIKIFLDIQLPHTYILAKKPLKILILINVSTSIKR